MKNEYFGQDEDAAFAGVEIQFDPKLRLAVEAMQDGLTLDQLWRVI